MEVPFSIPEAEFKLKLYHILSTLGWLEAITYKVLSTALKLSFCCVLSTLK